jgi:hypothetical protein
MLTTHLQQVTRLGMRGVIPQVLKKHIHLTSTLKQQLLLGQDTVGSGVLAKKQV